MDHSIQTLANGLTVASVRLPGFRTAAIGAFVRVGSRYEPTGLNGISHFLEHMAFKGTERRDARRISFEAELVGANMNAYTAKDHTAYYMVLLAEHARVALDVISDVLRFSTFPPDELERERGVILQEIGEAGDDPSDLVQDGFDLEAFPRQPFGRPILGARRFVRTVRRDDLIEYMHAHYTAANMIVVGVGGIDHARFLEQTAECFGQIPRGTPNRSEPARYKGGFRHVDGDFEQTSSALGWPVPPRSHERYAVYELLSDLFGGGMSSPLFQAVREQRGLAYAVDSYCEGHEDCGLFQISAGVAPKQLRAYFEVVCDELAALTGRIAPDDLQRARNQQASNLLMTLERPLALAEAVARDLFFHGRIVPIEETVARASRIDEADLRRAAADMLAAKPTLSVVGRIGRGDHYDAITQRLALGQAAA